MNNPHLQPIPHISTATGPESSASDLRQRWRALIKPLGFGEMRLWLALVGPDRRLTKVLSHVPIGPLPESRIMKNLMSALQSVLNEAVAGTTVALLLSRPGRGAISPTDRQWSRYLTEMAAQFGVPLEPIFRANDDSLVRVEPA